MKKEQAEGIFHRFFSLLPALLVLLVCQLCSAGNYHGEGNGPDSLCRYIQIYGNGSWGYAAAQLQSEKMGADGVVQVLSRDCYYGKWERVSEKEIRLTFDKQEYIRCLEDGTLKNFYIEHEALSGGLKILADGSASFSGERVNVLHGLKGRYLNHEYPYGNSKGMSYYLLERYLLVQQPQLKEGLLNNEVIAFVDFGEEIGKLKEGERKRIEETADSQSGAGFFLKAAGDVYYIESERLAVFKVEEGWLKPVA